MLPRDPMRIDIHYARMGELGNWLLAFQGQGAGKRENPSGYHVRRRGNAGLARIARKPAKAVHFTRWAAINLSNGR
jgi:hypothetical protein